MYQCGPKGIVVATDHARIHAEIRRVVRNSADAFGNDADKLEFNMRDGREMKLYACRSSIPESWVVGSHISGSLCPELAKQIRAGGGRVEGPDQGMQLGQLQTLRSDWFGGSVVIEDRSTIENMVTRHQIRVSSNEHNLHLIFNSPLLFVPAEVVKLEALALADHDEQDARPALFLPPAEGVGVQVVAAPTGSNDPLRAIALPPLLAGSLSYQPIEAQFEIKRIPIARSSKPLSQEQLEATDMRIYEPTILFDRHWKRRELEYL